MQNSWLITGGCGFIGTNLIAHLVKEYSGIKIRVLDNLSVGSKDDLAQVCQFVESDTSSLLTFQASLTPQVELIVGDIRDKEICLACSKDVAVIVHLAASTGVPRSVENPRLDMDSNVTGTFNLLEAARIQKVERFIFASSGAPLGEVELPIHEERAPKPVSPYGAGKLAGEGYCSAYYRTYGIKTISLRFGNVYGPRSKHKSSVVAKFIRQAIKGETLEIFGDGQQTRDFIYIDDLIRAIMLSVHANHVSGEVFQIATNNETMISDLVDKLLPIMADFGLRNIRLINTEPRTGDVKRNCSDTTKAKELLGWESEVEVSAGLKHTVEWFVSELAG